MLEFLRSVAFPIHSLGIHQLYLWQITLENVNNPNYIETPCTLHSL